MNSLLGTYRCQLVISLRVVEKQENVPTKLLLWRSDCWSYLLPSAERHLSNLRRVTDLALLCLYSTIKEKACEMAQGKIRPECSGREESSMPGALLFLPSRPATPPPPPPFFLESSGPFFFYSIFLLDGPGRLLGSLCIMQTVVHLPHGVRV